MSTQPSISSRDNRDPAPVNSECEQPFVSVVMPVRNEEASIASTLRDLVSQEYASDRFEILVVDGESTDATVRLVQEFANEHPNIHVLNNPHRLSSAARNIGVRNAQGDIIVIVDGHCEIRDRFHLTKLAKAFETSGADCLGRPQPLDITDASTLQRAIAAARNSRLGHHPESFIYSSQPQFVPAKSVAIAYRRSVFEKVGYFDETFDAHEDGEFNHRLDQAGLRCWFTPDVAVHYRPRGNLRGLFRQMVRYGRGRIRYSRKHPGNISLGTLLPAMFVAGLVVGTPLSLLSVPLAMIYAASLLLYLCVILCGSVMIAIRSADLGPLPWLLLVFPAIHVGAGVGLLREMLPGGCRTSCETGSYKRDSRHGE